MDWTVQSETTGERVNIHPELHSSHLNTRSQEMDHFCRQIKLALNQAAQAVEPISVLNTSWINSFESLESCGPAAAAWAGSTELPGSEQGWGCTEPGLLHTSKGHSSASLGTYPGCLKRRAMGKEKYQPWMVRAVNLKWLIWRFSNSKCSKWARFTHLPRPE